MDPNLAREILDQGWIVSDRIGSGEFGSVYKVHRTPEEESDTIRAGKLMVNILTNRQEISILYTLLFDSSLYSTDGDEVDGTTSEIQPKFRHPGLVYYVDAFEVCTPNYLFLVTDYFEGLTLMEFIIAEYRPFKHHLETIARTLLSTFDFIHTHQVVHRDVKLENVMFNPHTNETKLIDFGLSSTFDGIDIQRVGTPTYWPSEFPPPLGYRVELIRYTKLNVIDFEGYCKADIYALGIVLYEFATGTSLEPFSEGQLRELSMNNDLHLFPDRVKIFNIDDLWLANLILMCLTPDPKMRKCASELSKV